VETALAEGRSEPIHCYFGVRSERDVYQEAEFAALSAAHSNFRFQIVLSEPDAGSTRRSGFVTDAVRADLPSLDGFKTYFCGPPPMVEAAQRLARELGAGPDDVHADAFYTEAEKARGATSS
jgi:CDP-4-dehydro-6-deoxyglucose reductase/ferredoxin-NAD(P)+ reductase (naphthalene dioxygenase ferredoxin-specific)